MKKARMACSRTMLARLGLSVFFTMNVIAFTMALWTTDVYGASEPAGNLAPVSQRPFSIPDVDLLAACPFFARAAALRARLDRAATGDVCRRNGCWPRESPPPSRSRFSPSSAVEEGFTLK